MFPSRCEYQVIEKWRVEGYCEGMPATKSPFKAEEPTLTWQELKGWINSHARELLEFAKVGYSEVGRGLVILAGIPEFSEGEPAVKFRYIRPEEIADIHNEALDLAHQLVARYDPKAEFVVVTIDAIGHVTSALVAVDPYDPEVVH